MPDEQQPQREGDESALEKQGALRIAFYWAASDGDTPMVKELLIAGVDKGSCFEAALRAAENGHADTVSFLLDLDGSLATAKHALRLAANNEHLEAAKAILNWIDTRKTMETILPPSPKV